MFAAIRCFWFISITKNTKKIITNESNYYQANLISFKKHILSKFIERPNHGICNNNDNYNRISRSKLYEKYQVQWWDRWTFIAPKFTNGIQVTKRIIKKLIEEKIDRKGINSCMTWTVNLNLVIKLCYSRAWTVNIIKSPYHFGLEKHLLIKLSSEK